MITIHQKAIRGNTRAGWLNSYHTFSFGSFQDPKRMGFGNLRVLNEDTIIPGSGFAEHPHADMDILTYVTRGTLRHEDDQGNVSRILAGEAQLMSAGEGVTHSERNASDTDTAQLLQIWLIPDVPGGPPTYAQKAVPQTGNVELAGPKGSGALLQLRSDTTVKLLRTKEHGTTDLGGADMLGFVHFIDGLAHAEGERLSGGDGLQLPQGETTSLEWATDGTALLFTMPPTRKRDQHDVANLCSFAGRWFWRSLWAGRGTLPCPADHRPVGTAGHAGGPAAVQWVKGHPDLVSNALHLKSFAIADNSDNDTTKPT